MDIKTWCTYQVGHDICLVGMGLSVFDEIKDPSCLPWVQELQRSIARDDDFGLSL